MHKRSLLLHIGTEKTGTTTIQEFLSLNRQPLATQGILYPQSLGLKNHIRLAAYASDDPGQLVRNFCFEGEQARAAFRRDLRRQFHDELCGSPCRRVLVSNEHLHSKLCRVDQLADLRDLLTGFFDAITVLVYLRRQDLLAFSRHSTAIRSGGTQLCPFSGVNDYLYDFQQSYQQWAAAFGGECVKVRIFAKERFENGNLLDDFCAQAGIANDAGFVVPKRHNEALSLEAKLLLLEFNSDPGNLAMEKSVKQQLIADIQQWYPGPSPYPERGGALLFYQRFKEKNKQLARLLGHAPPALFDEDFSMYPTRVDPLLLKKKRAWAKQELPRLLAWC